MQIVDILWIIIILAMAVPAAVLMDWIIENVEQAIQRRYERKGERKDDIRGKDGERCRRD